MTLGPRLLWESPSDIQFPSGETWQLENPEMSFDYPLGYLVFHHPFCHPPTRRQKYPHWAADSRFKKQPIGWGFRCPESKALAGNKKLRRSSRTWRSTSIEAFLLISLTQSGAIIEILVAPKRKTTMRKLISTNIRSNITKKAPIPSVPTLIVHFF